MNMRKTVFAAATVLALAMIAEIALAHGGTYQGPQGGGTPGYSGPIGGGTIGPQPGGTTPPSTGGATPPPAGGATPPPSSAPTPRPAARGTGPAGGRGFGGSTGGRAKAKVEDRTTDWDWWWDLNEERFLMLKNKVRSQEASSDNKDTFLGGSLGGGASKVTTTQIRKDILPSLRLALKDPYYYARAGALIALCKVGYKTMPVTLSDLRAMLADKDKVVQESACLALGVLGNKESLADLLDVAKNTKTGQKLAGKEGAEVPTRMRSFAAVSIGLIGGREGFGAGENYIKELVTMATTKAPNQDLQVGPAVALQVAKSQEAVPALIAMYKDEDLDKWVRAHAGVALGKIGAKAAIPELVKGLDDKEGFVANSAAISLGLLTDPSDRETINKLIRYAKSAPERSTRNFCMIALGEIGDAKGKALLLENLSKGQMHDRTFSALALGIMGNKFEEGRSESGQALLATYKDLKSDQEKSAMAIALALCEYEPARAALAEDLVKGQGNQDLKGHLCTALGLLNHADSIPAIQELARQKGDQDLRKRASIALGLLKDPDAVDVLEKVIRESGASKAILGAATVALGYIGDRRAVPILVAMVENKAGEVQDVSRAFATVALGFLGDKDDIPCLSKIQENSNYLAQTEALAELLTIL